MNCRTPHWYPVLRSRELTTKPVGRKRFGEPLVFWRDATGAPVVFPDRCPHRGAALSLGKVKEGQLSCPFHGIEFGADGHCRSIPPEGNRPVPDDFKCHAQTVTESDGYIWLWRGPTPAHPTELPQPPQHQALVGLEYGESSSIWPAHYTRCIENVCDFSHLPFVHKTTIGMLKSEYKTQIEVETKADELRCWLLEDDDRSQHFEFIYPNLWLLGVSNSFLLSAVFVPVDENTTEVYGRTYARRLPFGTGWAMNVYTWLSQLLVFREDWPIVASQSPGDINRIQDEKLFPSDGAIIAYRKLHSQHTRAQ